MAFASVLLLLAALIDASIADLGDDAFLKREAASRKLETLLPYSVPALERALDSDDAETRHRARHILSRHEGRFRTLAWKLCGESPPWIDMAGGEPGSNSGWLSAARDMGMRHGVEDWPDYRFATVLWIEHRLRAGESPAELRKALVLMAANEAHYWKAHPK